MISLEDMEDMCSLTRAEIAQVAAHEHITEEAAVAEIERLMHQHGGPQALNAMLCEDIRAALHADNVAEARRLFALLRGFLAAHPEAVRGAG
jgi:threonine aldolase